MRGVPLWVGTSDDTPIPPRVKLRIFSAAGGKCALCTRLIGGSVVPCYDHIQALVNGGTNSEDNLRLLCNSCHSGKTRTDVREKSVVYRKRLKHLGIKRRKGKPLPGSKDSGWKHKMDGTWERRR